MAWCVYMYVCMYVCMYEYLDVLGPRDESMLRRGYIFVWVCIWVWVCMMAVVSRRILLMLTKWQEKVLGELTASKLEIVVLIGGGRTAL